MNAPETTSRLPAVAQPVAEPLTRAAIFLVATIKPGSDNCATVRSLCGDLAALVRAVDFRDLAGGTYPASWDLGPSVGPPVRIAPAGGLQSFGEFRSGPRHAVSTPGDYIFHIRARRMDFCFELAAQIMARIGVPLRRKMKCKVFVSSMIATSWVLSTGPKIPEARPCPTQS